MNVSQYAYEPDAGVLTLEVYVNEARSECSVVITMSDSGRKFNPLEHEDPDTSIPLEQRSLGGLGILLVKQLMTNVDYTYDNGHNQNTVTKSWRKEAA